MKSRILHIIICIAVMASLLTSCRDALCYDHYPAVQLDLSWEAKWEHDYGMHHSTTWDAELHGFGYDYLMPGVPEWVKMIKYSGENVVSVHSLDPDGGRLNLSPDEGASSMLLYNGDTEYLVFLDMASMSDARATATSRSRSSIAYLQERFPGTRTTNPPDVLYSACVDVPHVENHVTHPLPVKMQPVVYSYVIRYEFEHGIEHVALARGALAGMAESVYLRDGSTPDQSTIILYDCTITSYGCMAVVRSFGVPGFTVEAAKSLPERLAEKPFTLNLEVMLQNGKILEFDHDISSQIVSQPRGGVITVSGIRVEDIQNQTESGFEVDVSGWGNHEDIELPVGTDE